ncbi:MAG TPA: glycoside hydrolase N-terminal domain-containing protein [Candidatus Acidoferrales bacterium]|jgi:alpha-L-fucosidase 2|nr:glycoside hydrolase N-terminal domain-containing protein [Candidatus Acidoferrales bacterium]
MVARRLRLILLVVVTLYSANILGRASTYSQRLGLSYRYPTSYTDWQNAFLAGNGKMGIMVFGNPLDETVIYNDREFNLAANTNSLLRTFDQVSDADLSAIRSNCVAGNFEAADELAASAPYWRDGGEQNRHPGFEMLIGISPDGPISNYRRVCDFRIGEITVSWTDARGDWTRKAFVSRKDNVIVQYLSAPTKEKLTCSIQLTTDPKMNFPTGMTFKSLASSDFLNMRANYPPSAGSAGYEGVTRVVANGGSESVDGSTLNISNAAAVVLLTRTSRYGADCERQWNWKLLQKQLEMIPANYQTLLAGQIATHETIYDRVQLDLNASAADRAKSNEELLDMQKNSTAPVRALWERVFDAGRYYFLSSSDSNTPPDLLGLWTGDCNAGWGGFYTLDANLNLQVAGGNIGDMPEAMEGYFKINEGWRADFETNAIKLLGCRGMLASGNTPGTNGLMAAINSYYPYQYATGEEGWLLYPFWEHYLITGDAKFLRDRLYPLFKDMGYFYEDFLTCTGADGHYIFAGSISPENQPSNVHCSLVNNSTFDISGARFCLGALLQTCHILKLDRKMRPEIQRWNAILDKLPPYLVNADGALQEWAWPGLKDHYDHRHSSGLLPVWPYQEITPDSTPDYFRAALVTLAKKNRYNYEDAGHGLLHSALIAANLKNSRSVNAKLLRLTSEGFYYDSLCSSHYRNHGVFCTDTCNTVPAIMMEMLVGSSPGLIELLPALPPSLTRGSISGVKARSRLTIEKLSWDMSSGSISCVLKSDINQSITLIERSGIASIATSAPIAPSLLGKIARVIQLRAGASTVIKICVEQVGQTAQVNEDNI